MTTFEIMTLLENRGFTFKLYAEALEPKQVTADDEALLAELSKNRNKAIEVLVTRYLSVHPVPLPSFREISEAIYQADLATVDLIHSSMDAPDELKERCIELRCRSEDMLMPFLRESGGGKE